MMTSGQRLSRPVYEGLPWFYLALGLGALTGSYYGLDGALSLIIGLMGFVGLLGGIVVLLRRRDFRAMRARYGNSVSFGTLLELGKD